jgi:hypothetical protein
MRPSADVNKLTYVRKSMEPATAVCERVETGKRRAYPTVDHGVLAEQNYLSRR